MFSDTRTPLKIFDNQTSDSLPERMNKKARICLFLCISTAVAALYLWPRFSQIKLYTAAELTGLTCEQLSEKHEEVIFAYHDAALRHYRKTGAFPDDLGLPRAEDLPFSIVMNTYIQENALTAFDLSKPFSLSEPRQNKDFFYEVSRVCAVTPSLDAMTAVGQAAQNLNLMD